MLETENIENIDKTNRKIILVTLITLCKCGERM